MSWSPVGSDTVCGPVTYNITVMPSHGMMMMINDTAYNITGLYYNTNYIITVYATNNAGDGKPAIVTVKTKGSYLLVPLYINKNVRIYAVLAIVCYSAHMLAY